MISAENFESDCDDRIDNDGDEFIDDYDSDCELVGLLIVEPELGAGLDSSQIQRITPDNYLDYWESYGEVVCVEDDYELVLLGSTYASLINAPLVIEGNEPSGLDLVGKNVICIGSVSVNCDEQYTLEELQQKYVDETNTDKIMLVNPGDLDIKVDYEFQPEKSQGSIYEIYGKTSLVAPILASVKHEIIIPIGENTAEAINNLLETNAHEWGIEKGFLTVIGTPDAVESSIMMLSGGILQKAYADIMEYSILDDDKLFDLVPGRIFGISMSDVSSYISRVIFYNQLEKSDSIVSLATDFSVGIVSVKAYKQLFELISYDSSEIIGYDDERPFIITSEDYSDKFFIFYDDHGTGNWMGINAIQFPLLKNSLIFGLGCSTCYYRTYKSPYLVCAQSLRKGAIGYWGMIEGGGSINPQAFVSNIFTDKTLGEAYLASSSADFLNYGLLEIFNYLQKFGLIGDPTLKMNPSYILPYSEVNKIGEDTYEINLKVAPIPTELFSHEGSLNGEMRDITVPATVTPIFSSRTNDNSLVISYSKQYYRFDSYTQEVITEEKNNLKFAIKAGPIPLSREYTDIEVSGNFNGRASIEKEELIGGQKYVWVYLDNNNLAPTYDLPFTIPETGDLFETINFQFELI